MSDKHELIDHLLASALRGDGAALADLPDAPDPGMMIERIAYHGVAGLLAEKLEALADWPDSVRSAIRSQAIAAALWELRHHQILGELLAALAGGGVPAVLLKGSAMAYDLYPAPATRIRGDTDVLIEPRQVGQARRILAGLAFERTCGTDESEFGLQEVWTLACDGALHRVDLHWQLLNTPALASVLSLAECRADLRPLPRLSPDAVAMDHVATLIHTCVHRALNSTSPYFVDGRTYFGGDRLIWLSDIDLLSRCLSDEQWARLAEQAWRTGVGRACVEGIEAAQRVFTSPLPPSVRAQLSAPGGARRPRVYLRARQLGRAWGDVLAIPGWGAKWRYARTRGLPSSDSLRARYGRLARAPLPVLYARRAIDLLRARPAWSDD